VADGGVVRQWPIRDDDIPAGILGAERVVSI